MKTFKKLLITLGALALITGTAQAAPESLVKMKMGEVEFTILDHDGVETISGISVVAQPADGGEALKTVSAANGSCSLELAQGKYLLKLNGKSIAVMMSDASFETNELRLVLPGNNLIVGGKEGRVGEIVESDIGPAVVIAEEEDGNGGFWLIVTAVVGGITTAILVDDDDDDNPSRQQRLTSQFGDTLSARDLNVLLNGELVSNDEFNNFLKLEDDSARNAFISSKIPSTGGGSSSSSTASTAKPTPKPTAKPTPKPTKKAPAPAPTSP